MKNVTYMKYGNTKLPICSDDYNILQIIKSSNYEVTKSEDDIIADALENPIDSARLRELVYPGQTVCLVIPDATRAWQKTHKYLSKIVDELIAGGIQDSDIVFLSALGTHRPQTKEEHATLLGEDLKDRFTVIDHDCHDKSNLVYVGKTTYGTPVSINKLSLECDHVIITGAIIYHFLVGWSGGKKSLVPGIASYETIMANHALSLNDNLGHGTHPNVRSGNIRSNPLHDDMLQAASFIRPTFMFNVIMGPDGNIAGAVAGNYISAHEAGRNLVDSIDGVDIKEKADVVIASAGGYPKDINLYQSIKTLINAREAARDGGTIILISECREGIGGDSDIQDIILNFDNLIDREKSLRDRYSISKFVGYYFCETAEKFKLILVSELDPEILRNAKVTVVKDLNQALDMVYGENTAKLKTHLMPQAANTLPKIP
ncbi:MAG: nickel-dependent lactate racemase [Bacillota bacterium]|nr:nickel-dependent lactate racemase [Bacillota bacterium]